MARVRNTSSPLFVLVATVVVVGALYFAKAILLPFCLAVLLSFLLTPPANRIERWGVPRIPAVLVVVGISFVIIGVLLWTVAVQAIDLGTKIDSYRDNIFSKIRAIGGETGRIGRLTGTLEEISKQLTADSKLLPRVESTPNSATPQPSTPKAPRIVTEEERSEDAPGTVEVTVVESPLAQIRNWLGPLMAPFSSAGLVVVLVLFILVTREDQRNRLIQLFGTSNLHLTTEALTDAANRVMRYLRMQFLINSGYGLCVAGALWALGVPNGVMWGVLGFMLRFLPYIGPILAAMLPIVVSAAVSDGWTTPLLVVGWYIVLELVLNNIVEPLLYGNSIGVSAVGIIVAAIFWTWLWGPIGLVLAMPLTVCLVVTAHYVPQLRFVTVMLGDEPALSPAERTYQRLLAMDDEEALKLAKQYLKSGTLTQYYDEVLLPALALAERDRHASLLSDEQESFVDEAAEDLVEELAPVAEREEAGGDHSEKHDPPTGANGTKESADPPVRVLCLPLRDRADHTMTMMLAQLLAADGLHVDVGSIDSLTNERVDEAARLNSQIAVISIVPPCSPRSSRLLGRRLHQRYPDLPVIVSYWSAVRGERLQQRFDLNEPDRLTINLAEAIAAVKREARRIANHAARPREATTAASY